MTKQEIINVVLELKKQVPLGYDEEKYIVDEFASRYAFQPNFSQLMGSLKEVVVEMKNPDFLQEYERNLVEIASTMTNANLSQEQLMESFISELANKPSVLGGIIEDVNDEMRKIFVQKIVYCLEDYRIRFDEAELMEILKGETNRRTNKLQEQFSDDMSSSIRGDLTTTVDNVKYVRNENLSNKSLARKIEGYEEDLYNEIIFHLQRANHTDRVTFSENYYEMLVDLRHRTRAYEELYLDALSTGIEPLSTSIENLLDEVMSKSNEMSYNNEELVQSANAMMFK